MRNYLLEKSCTICGGETSSKPFFKNLIIFLHQKFLVCLCCISKSRTTKINWNQGPDHLLLTHIIPFWKTKGVFELVSLSHALHHFWRKLFFKVYSINWPNFIASLSLLLEILQYVHFNFFCFRVDGFMNFEINLSSLIKAFSYLTKKVNMKI